METKKATAIITILVILSIAFSGCIGNTTSTVIEEKTLYNQIAKGEIHALSGRWPSYSDCIIVLSDYTQYRYYPENYPDREGCRNFPLNKNITIMLTKYSDSEGRYDISSYVIME
jgi:hypothetical protein